MPWALAVIETVASMSDFGDLQMNTALATKKLPANFRVERAGLAAISSFADDWGWIWRPTTPPDTGIDGTLEIAEPSGVTTGLQLGIQSKSGRSYFRNETDSTFEFHASPADLSYWENYSLAVLLCVYDPILKALYGVSIRDYLRDKPECRARPHRIIFDKEADLITEDARDWMRSVAAGRPRSYGTRIALGIQEVLHTNLLPVVGVATALYSTAFREGMEPGHLTGEIAINKENRCWTLHHPSLMKEPARNWVNVDDVKPTPWPEALGDPRLQGYVFELLYRALRAHTKGLPLAFDRKRKRYFFLPKDGDARTWQYQSLRRRAKRTVVHRFAGKYWAHHAVRLTWELYGDRLFLKLVPAYVFTDNAKNVQADEDVVRLNVRKRKREYNRQVFQHLIFWREVLARDAGQIRIGLGSDEASLLLDKAFLCQQVGFGIYGDRQSLSQIAEPIAEAIDETALEAGAESEDDAEETGDAVYEGEEAC